MTDLETIEALRQAEQKYRSIFENSVVGIFQTTPDGRYLSANSALARMYGYQSPPELITALTDISGQLYVAPNRRAEFQRLMREHRCVQDFESQIHRRDGSVIWISENAREVRDEISGELLYYEGMVQDITPRKDAEEARLRADARKNAQYEVTRVLAQSDRLSDVAKRIMQSICESIGWDYGEIWNIDPAAGVLRCVDIWHSPDSRVEEYVAMTRQMSFAPGEGLPGRVWSSRKAFWVPDVVEDGDFPRAALAKKSELHGGFAFPIQLGGEVIGVMEFLSHEIHSPDDDLLSMLTALGTQIGQFIERERVAIQLARYAEDLRLKNAQFEADIEMARDIQQVFLTQQYPAIPHGAAPGESWLRFCHRYMPAERVGGDFFCAIALSDHEAGVFICDVVGHGLRAALVTAIVRGLIEELEPIGTDPGRFLTEINRGMTAIFRQTETPMLASAFYLVANVATGDLSFANAGHPHPFHVRRSAGTVELLRCDGSHGPALGIFRDAVYGSGRRVIEPNDLVVLFTDGLFEVEADGDEYYGEQRLHGAVRERMALPAPELFKELLAEIEQSCVGKFADDVCLVGLEIAHVGASAVDRSVA